MNTCELFVTLLPNIQRKAFADKRSYLDASRSLFSVQTVVNSGIGVYRGWLLDQTELLQNGVYRQTLGWKKLPLPQYHKGQTTRLYCFLLLGCTYTLVTLQTASCLEPGAGKSRENLDGKYPIKLDLSHDSSLSVYDRQVLDGIVCVRPWM